MATPNRRYWVKLQMIWYTTPSHEFLSPEALHSGGKLLCLADVDPTWRETGTGRLLNPVSGSFLTAQEIARATRWSVEQIEAIMAELVACGTVTGGPDEGWSFPNYRKWQEDRVTTWRRDQSDDVAMQHATQRAPQHAPHVARQHQKDQKDQRARGPEGEKDHVGHAPPGTPLRGTANATVKIAHAFEAITGLGPSERTSKVIVDGIRDGHYSLEEVLAVLAAIEALPRSQRPRGLTAIWYEKKWPRTREQYTPRRKQQEPEPEPAEPVDANAGENNAAAGEAYLAGTRRRKR